MATTKQPVSVGRLLSVSMLILSDRRIGEGRTGERIACDRAALDYAIDHGIPRGGFCPKGRRGEDGAISPKYQLKETGSRNNLVRAHLNIQEFDATVVFTPAKKATGGTKKTINFAKKHKKPRIHLHQGVKDLSEQLRRCIEEHGVQRLNVAGHKRLKGARDL